MALRPAVFLDRDGVINRTAVRDGTPHPPGSLEELEVAMAKVLNEIRSGVSS